MKFKKGQWVYYKNGQRGKMKSQNEKYIFVVFNCAGEWDRYDQYAGQVCKPEDLSMTKPINAMVDEIKENLPEGMVLFGGNNAKQ